MKIGLAQINSAVGDVDKNTDTILQYIKDYGQSVDMLIFPEMALSGYPPQDLLNESSFLDRVESRENTNVSLSWYSNDGATSIRAYVNNLMDNENYYALSTGDHETNYRKSVTPLPPRVMGVDLRYRF